MDAILSIQSHVVYGYVGNKAAAFPLQTMGFDVWPVNTVQFSNHTGYGKWQGKISSASHIISLIDGIFEIGQEKKCKAILSGYMGSQDICHAVSSIVDRFKSVNENIYYLCDPVIGNDNCYVKPEVFEFFKNNLKADIITPNKYEAELLSGISINSIKDLKNVAIYFHNRDIKIVVVTGIKFPKESRLQTFASDGKNSIFVSTAEINFIPPINGTGDLFSSVFLGTYLKYKDILTALRYAVFYLQKVVEATYLSKKSELQVLSVRYETIEPSLLPDVVSVA